MVMPYFMTRLVVPIGLLAFCFKLSLGDQSPEGNKDEKEEEASL